MKFFTIFLIISGSFFISSKAQLVLDIQNSKSIFQEEAKEEFIKLAKGSKNELESTFSMMFVFYKKYISSQDIDACVFYPSCSVYAIECIHHENKKLVAFFKISDRIMRCHPLISSGTYKIDKSTSKFLDPIEN